MEDTEVDVVLRGRIWMSTTAPSNRLRSRESASDAGGARQTGRGRSGPRMVARIVGTSGVTSRRARPVALRTGAWTIGSCDI